MRELHTSRGDWRQDLRSRLASLRLGAAREAEIVEELTQHLDDRYGQLRAEGASLPKLEAFYRALGGA